MVGGWRKLVGSGQLVVGNPVRDTINNVNLLLDVSEALATSLLKSSPVYLLHTQHGLVHGNK